MYKFYVLLCILYFAVRMNKLILNVILEKNVHDIWNLNEKPFGNWNQKQNNWKKFREFIKFYANSSLK